MTGTNVQVAGVPFALTASGDSSWTVDEAGVSATASPRSDIFIDPSSGGSVAAETLLNASTLLGAPPVGDFTFTAHVEVDFQATFDAGVLLLWLDQSYWAKLCFEFSPDAQPMIVTVVARGVADDANAFTVDSSRAWLRIARVGSVYAFHASTDGERWHLVRAFALGHASTSAEVDMQVDMQVGLEVQSPTGQGCAVRFTSVRFESRTLSDLRDGS